MLMPEFKVLTGANDYRNGL